MNSTNTQSQKTIYQVYAAKHGWKPYFTNNCLAVLNLNFDGIKSSLTSPKMRWKTTYISKLEEIAREMKRETEIIKPKKQKKKKFVIIKQTNKPEEDHHKRSEFSKNGFQLYDIDNQPIFSKFGFNTYDEINVAIQADFKWNETCVALGVEVIKPNSVIIQFNGLALTFDIKGHNGDYDLEFVSVEDA